MSAGETRHEARMIRIKAGRALDALDKIMQLFTVCGETRCAMLKANGNRTLVRIVRLENTSGWFK